MAKFVTIRLGGVTLAMILLLGGQFMADAQVKDSSFQTVRLGFGVGYLHTGGEIRSIWTDGFALNIVIGYNPWESLGFELTGVYGSTGITDSMKNKVHTVDQYTGVTGTSESKGGEFLQLLFGPSFSNRIPGSDFVLSFGAGGSYYGSKEGNMSDIEGYFPRWTYGWGYYVQTWFGKQSPGSRGFFYGITVRYSRLRAKVNDFYYDRVYGASGYDQIPPTYVWDSRLEISLNVGLGFQ